jgi:hypothetical protein
MYRNSVEKYFELIEYFDEIAKENNITVEQSPKKRL